MAEYNLSYREVIPIQTSLDSWKEITLNTGGTQSTLQDIKVIEKSNGYCYRDASKHHTRNRFIYWKINSDTLEIVEHSLDINLTSNKVRYRFVDAPILDGISIHETYENVIILVPTVCSVHKLTFPHPDCFYKQAELFGPHPDLSVPSIFCEASVAQARDPSTFYIFHNPSTANSQLPHCATSLLCMENEALFLFAYPSNEIILVKHSSNGHHETIELKNESYVNWILSGIADKFLSKNSETNIIVSMVLHVIGLETFALTLARDGHLKLWSCAKGQCIAVNDFISEIGCKHLVQGAQNHIIKKAVGVNDCDFTIAVFLRFSTECQFHILKIAVTGSQMKLTRINTLHSPEVDLVDFALSPTKIWSIWREEDGGCIMYTADINTAISKGSHWVPVVLESLPDANNIPINEDMEPKQIYLEHIFYPGRFPLNIISKALSIYKRSPVNTDINLSVNVLKQRVCMAVENAIQAELNECEVTDEDYLECASWCWSRFYSCCVQYHVAALKPLGLLLLPSVSGAVLLKKSMYSLLRPLDALEHLMLSSEYATREQLVGHPQLCGVDEETEDLMTLMSALVYLEEQLSLSFKMTFEKEMSQLRSPDVVVSELVKELFAELDKEFTNGIMERIEKCSDLYQAIHKLLEILRLDQHGTPNKYAQNHMKISIDHLFSSSLGISFVSQCLKQQAALRFSICRNLLVLQNILLEEKEQNSSSLESIRSVCMPEIVVLTQAYHVLQWFSDVPSQPTLPLESMLQRLTPIKLAPVFNLNLNSLSITSLLDLFISSSGGQKAHKMLSSATFDEDSSAHWHTSLLPYVSQLIQLIWPVSSDSMLSEWLLSSGQHLPLQQYVRLMNNWCQWNDCSRNFISATAYLCTGEFHKAYDLFLKARRGIHSEAFLKNNVLFDSSRESLGDIAYFLKVTQLFELHGSRNYVIAIAQTALSEAEETDPLKATLYSIKFKHYLALGHYEQAYAALNENPDLERKKANLRDFVKDLLERKQLSLLLSFPYTGLEQLFCSILFTRARATDSINNVYYDFLYAYQMKRGTSYMRLAASIMYEQAFRLMQYNTMEALEKQVKCYLAAINSLNLCEKKFAWVLRPADPDLTDEEIVLSPLAGSDESPEKLSLKRQIEVVELQDMKRELEFSSARLQLSKINENIITSQQTTPTELVAFLNSTGLFKLALSISTTFELSYDAVFEALTQHCVKLMKPESAKMGCWLLENDLHDLPLYDKKPSVIAWNLLQSCLFKYEEKGRTELHKVVCRKLISMKTYIPHWLLASYKLRNPGELLRLFICYGYLDGACKLATEHILAAMGHGVEHFGYEQGIIPTGPEFCLPVHVINGLLYELELQNEADPKQPYSKEYKTLSDLFKKYLEVSSRISNEMCRSKFGASMKF